jgi:cell division protein FtsB
MNTVSHLSYSKRLSSSYAGGREGVAFVVCLLLCFYLCFHLFAGERSYLRFLSLNATIQSQEVVLKNEVNERYTLENKIKMMRPDSIDRDFVEERVRSVLGYAYPSEAVILK